MEQVDPVNDTLLLTEWRALIRQTSPDVHTILTGLSDDEIRHLVTVFYDYMLSHAESALFLNTEQVSTRLSGSMFDWLRSVLGSAYGDLPRLLAKQREIGVVHARIGLPIDLVNRGARKLKEELYQLLKSKADYSVSLLTDAICFSSLAMDTALEAMTVSYSPSYQNSLHTQEQYRLQTIYDDVNVERERQIRSFTDWENQFIYNIATGLPSGDLVFLADSDFGMWFSHKGKHILGSGNLLAEMESVIAEIDNRLTQALSNQQQPGETERMSLLQDVRQLSAKIHFLLASMFEALVKQENGKDSLTQLLNRRFIPTIMRREISLALHSRKPFTLAMLDIDYFKQINDSYGHNTGDMTLKNVAAVIYEHIRSSDYVFRYGGEEFMILLVESDESQASIILETLRKKIAELRIAASMTESFSITVSIGVAEYDYHPDYKQLVDKADRALYLAKSHGRNRVETYRE
ncbi:MULTISPECIES: diguanylate cyclase [Citrobacter]|uniref:Diguanylate cyclase DosC n=1 Tax=Citrobacter pasteurii TaxID=1563222 RepID=A0ABX8K8H8_9ENTR|nr:MULTISPECIES: diguanylate cyclase [Citrobacter]EIQ74873.1 diguanylate cyclase domain protein [Shigella flexneri 1235-66]MBA4710925.1 diguanylate cyclase [Citrobacter pasteurii]MBD0802438.1 diguanylate cyclase [Citrobacter sp. C6_1]MBD0812078.1 diguanylate cyclase [Citrobacter sp. C6_2]MBJ8888709.1 diguanylate cyclase [Citrobacter sp. FDAARGOS_156]